LSTAKSLLDSLAVGIVYSIIIVLVDFILLLIIFQELTQVMSYLSLIVLAEGGLGLIVGGFIGMNSPIIRRLEEDIFHVKAQKLKDRKELEKQAGTLILTGIILIIVALLLSLV